MNKNQNRIRWIGIVLAWTMLLSGIAFGMQFKHCQSPEQTAEIYRIILDQHRQGATVEEAQEVIHKMMQSRDSEHRDHKMGEMDSHRHRPLMIWMTLWDQLTTDQLEELLTAIAEIRENDSDRQAVREVIREKLAEWNIEMPDRQENSPGKRSGHRHGFGQLDLDETQRNELHDLVDKLHQEGFDRAEIHKAVQEQLTQWGKEFPPPPFFEGDHQAWLGMQQELTHDQFRTLHHMARDMRRNGDEPPVIQKAVTQQLIEWGFSTTDDNSDTGLMTSTSTIMSAANQPNPFNPETIITYTLTEPAQVRIDVYNLMGQKVATLLNNQVQTGFQEVVWNGRSDQGYAVPSGTYLYRIQAGNEVITNTMSLMK